MICKQCEIEGEESEVHEGHCLGNIGGFNTRRNEHGDISHYDPYRYKYKYYYCDKSHTFVKQIYE